MPPRYYSKEQSEVAKAHPRVYLSISMDEYQEIAADARAFRHWLDEQIEAHPNLFPASINDGYVLHDYLPESRKLSGVRFRRIQLKATDVDGKRQVLTICSSDIMPHMTGYTDEVEKALFLRRFGVPFWALTYVFGRNDDYWYNMVCHFGQYDLVDTVVQDPTHLPKDLLADEKHTRFNGAKSYVAMTVGADCVLGASLALNADEASLTTAYGRFRDEALGLDPSYAPETINTDGWSATQNAWRALFPAVIIIQCFLHAFLKIRDRAKKRFQVCFDQIQQQVWDIYRAVDKADFLSQIADFEQWVGQTLSGPALDAALKLCEKADLFALTFDHPTAYRTSNMIDRHMIPLDRWLQASNYFHGHWKSAELQTRAWALFHDFLPYCPRAEASRRFISPAHRLNRTVYHKNWLHNLLISTSCSGLSTYHRKS